MSNSTASFVLMAVCMIWSDISAENAMYLFKIQSPVALLTEPWCGVYQGKPLVFSGNVAFIKAEKATPTFSILVTSALTFNQAGCTIRSLARYDHLPMRWFDLSLVFDEKSRLWRWNIRELMDDEAPTQLPYHTIIIFLDPCLVKELRFPCCVKYARNLAYRDNASVFELPTLILREASWDCVQAACKAGHLAYLDIRWIHAPIASEERIIDCVVLKQTATCDV